MKESILIEELKSHVAKIEIQPGDTLGIFYESHLSTDQREALLAALQRVIPSGAKCVILDGGAKVAVIKWPTTPHPDA
jgi:hypothetical protein